MTCPKSHNLYVIKTRVRLELGLSIVSTSIFQLCLITMGGDCD